MGADGSKGEDNQGDGQCYDKGKEAQQKCLDAGFPTDVCKASGLITTSDCLLSGMSSGDSYATWSQGAPCVPQGGGGDNERNSTGGTNVLAGPRAPHAQHAPFMISASQFDQALKDLR
jgi:hypothetical protein